MNKLTIGFIGLVLLVGQAFLAEADIYSWTDENGVRHFTNTPPPETENLKQEPEHKIDEETRQKLEALRKREHDEVYGKVPVGSSKYVTKNPGAVVFYSKKRNLECDNARHFFDKFSIPYTEYDIETDEAAKAKVAQFGGRAPLIIIGGRPYKYFDSSIYYGLFGIKRSGASIRKR